MSFDPSLPGSTFNVNEPIPAPAAPNAIVAPYWNDLITEVCVRNDANRTIVEWVGEEFSFFGPWPPVHFQASLYTADGRVELRYGPGHGGTGASTTIGVENADGTAGIQLTGSAGSTAPGRGEVLFAE